MTKILRDRPTAPVRRHREVSDAPASAAAATPPSPRRPTGDSRSEPARRPRSIRDRADARARFNADGNVRLRALNAQNAADKKPVKISGTNGRDRITVSETRDGRTRVENNGRVTVYDRGQSVVVDARGGNDRVVVRGNVEASVLGGAGHDRIDARRSRGGLSADGGDGNDRIIGGRNRDFLLGGRGNDRLLGNGGEDQLEGGDGNDGINGGRGRDVLYGGRGGDRITGGTGRDYLSGEDGVDVLRGGDGDDAVSGGRGLDVLLGGNGDDALIGGSGLDIVSGGAGDNKIHQESPEIPDNIEIRGSPEYRQRVRSDLETLAATPAGRQLLDAIAARDHRVTIKPGDNFAETALEGSERNPDGTPGTGTKRTTIGYNIDTIDLGDGVGQLPTPVVLYHELVHTYNYATGTTPRESERTRGTENAELIAVGLPIDHDGNPNTPEIQPNPYFENLFREQLNIPLRERY